MTAATPGIAAAVKEAAVMSGVAADARVIAGAPRDVVAHCTYVAGAAEVAGVGAGRAPPVAAAAHDQDHDRDCDERDSASVPVDAAPIDTEQMRRQLACLHRVRWVRRFIHAGRR